MTDINKEQMEQLVKRLSEADNKALFGNELHVLAADAITALLKEREELKAENKPCPLSFEQIESAMPEGAASTEDGYVKVSAQWLHDFARRLLALAVPDAEPVKQHYDDYAVDCFAELMKEKLRYSREVKGRGGWNDPKQCSIDYLNQLLLEHIEKGDPVDVANICMMLRHYNARIVSAHPAPSSEAVKELVEALEAMRDALEDAARDGERYRWLRDRVKADPKMDGNHLWYFKLLHLKGESLDAAIDAAIRSMPLPDIDGGN